MAHTTNKHHKKEKHQNIDQIKFCIMQLYGEKTTKKPPWRAIEAEYRGYCGMGHKIASFSDLMSSCIILWT